MTTYVLPFEKMHGLGNDFILLEKRNLPNTVDEKALAKHLCNRNFGIGADGIIIVDLSSSKDADFAWGYYNSDGSEAEMCGNGMRCFAKYVFERGFIDSTTFLVQTKAGIISPSIEPDGSVTVNMGKPKVKEKLKEELKIDGETIYFTYVEMGNPHCVIFMDNEVKDEILFTLGPKIENHKLFPNKTNVEFVNVINNNEIKCRVWERGAGATLACGTGASAVLVAAHLNDLTMNEAVVSLPGGVLRVKWDKDKNNVYLNGPTSFVFTGQYNLDPRLVCKVMSKS